MATLISCATGDLTGATTFARTETGTGALNLIRFNHTSFLAAAGTITSVAFTVTNGSVIDGVLLWVKQGGPGSTGTFKVALNKAGVEQASVTVDKVDLAENPTATPSNTNQPTFFKFTGTATGDGAATWTLVLTTTGVNHAVYYGTHVSGSTNVTRALRTTTLAAPATNDDLYIVGELTGAGAHTSRTVTMNSTVATVYGSAAINSTTVNGGIVAISMWGTLTYGSIVGNNYILRVAGDVSVYQFGALNIVTSAGGDGDPYWDKNPLVMHFDGADGSNTGMGFKSELGGVPAAVSGDAQIDTAQSKFGGSSLLLDGGGDRVRYADSPVGNLLNVPFTIECWIRPATVAAGTYFIVCQWETAPNLGWSLSHSGSLLRFSISTTGTDNFVLVSGGTLVANVWHAVCVDFDGVKYRLYIDGVMVGSSTTLYTIFDSTLDLCIGASSTSGGLGFNGWIDELRMTRGVGRYASDAGYMVATSAFPSGSYGGSTAVLEFQPTATDCEFGLRCLDGSVVTITGQPRTSGKLVTKCKLTADVASANVINTLNSGLNGSVASVSLEASGNSLTANSWSTNATNASHSVFGSFPNLASTTQTATVWIARGSGTYNRYVRLTMGNVTTVTSVTTGFYSDIDLQAGTAGPVTAIGAGVATSVSITPMGIGFLIRMTGRISTVATGTFSFIISTCSAPGTLSFAADTTQSFIYDHMAVVTAASIPDTVFNVDADTGWLVGDAVCVASTTRNQFECEIYPLNANAGASSFTSALYPFSQNVISTHSGVAPTQAEIGLITRNVKIRSTSPTLMAYVLCSATSTVTASWAEFYYFGVNTNDKRSIEIDGGPVCGPKSFTYCSIHDTDAWGILCDANGVADLNVTVSNCVFWLSYSADMFAISGPVTSTNWVFDNNLLMRQGAHGVVMGDVGGTCTNNTVVGISSNNYAFRLTETTSVPIPLGNFDNNTAHSGAGHGMNPTTAAGFTGAINNFTAWRINGAGFVTALPLTADLTFNNMTLFGCNNGSGGGFAIQSGFDTINIKGGFMVGETAYACQNGLVVTPSITPCLVNMYNVDMSGVSSGYVPHTGTDLLLNSGNYHNEQGIFTDCKFGAPTLYSSKTFWGSQAWLSFHNFNQVAGDHRTEMKYGQVRADAAPFLGTAPSMRMTPNNASSKLESAPRGRGLKFPVRSGDTVTVSVWARKQFTFNGNQPRLILRANPAIGITADTVLATLSATGTSTATAVWESATATNVTLSGGDRVVTTTTGATAGAHVGFAHGLTTGKRYYENTITSHTGGAANGVAIGTALATYGGLATALEGVAMYLNNGNIYAAGVTSGFTLGARATGQVIGSAVDLDNRKFWCRHAPSGLWNGNASHDPAANVGGVAIPAGAIFPFAVFGGAGGQVGNAFTTNFGQSAFSGAVPSGFTSGWQVAGHDETWNLLSGVTAAATADGLMEFVVDCDGVIGYVNLDEWTFTTGGVTTVCNLSDWVDGLPYVKAGGGGGGGGYFSAGFV